MLVDTDVLVWLFRGRESARSTIVDCPSVELSAVTYMELVRGVRDKRELSLLRRTVSENAWRIVPIGEAISHRATLYIENYAPAHVLRLADALIAATATELGTGLVTANSRHYRFLPGMSLQLYRP